MAVRTQLARTHFAAPVAWVNNEVITVAASQSVEITDRFPVYYERGQNHIDRMPEVILRAVQEPVDPATPVRVDIDDGAGGNEGAYYPIPVAAGLACVAVDHFRPRQLSTSTTLMDGRRVYLTNEDGVNNIDVTVAFGVPLKDWE